MTVCAAIKALFVMSALPGLTIGVRAADGVGKVCVQKIPSGPSSGWKANDSGATEGSTFSVRIDDLPAVNVTTNSSGVFTNLSLTKKHLGTIRLDDKPLTSFRFGFESRPGHLRLWYNSFYGTWSLSDVRTGEKCACLSSTPPGDGLQRTAAPQSRSDIPEATQTAISQLRVGMKETEAVALTRPVATDYGRFYYGGTRRGRLYFGCGSTQQVRLEASGGPASVITEIGSPEPKAKWTRHTGDSITVELRPL